MTAPAQTTDVAQATGVERVAAWRPPLLRSLPLRLAVLGICLLWTIPTLGLLVTSIRDPLYITKTGWWTALFSPLDPPNQWTLSNYSTVIASDGMGNSFINSLIVAIPSTVIPITIAAFAAYAFAWIPFRGRGILFTIVVGLLVVPIQMSLIPILQIYSAGNLYGTFLGIWLAHTGFGLPLAIFLLYNFISQLPRDLFESAAIDGASHLQAFIRIVLPLSIPAIGAFAIFQFLWVWNDLLVALVFLGPGAEVRVLPDRPLPADRQPRRLVASAHRRRVHHDGRAADRVPAAPAGIRARDPGRLRQVLTPAGAPTAAAMSRWYQRGAVLGRPAQGVEVDVDQAEPPAVAEAPLVVVQQRPHVVAGQRHAGIERVGGRRHVACEVGDPGGVADPAVLVDGVGVRGAVLGHDDLARRVVLVELEQRVAQAVGRNVPVHLRLLRARHARRSPSRTGASDRARTESRR